MSPFGGTSVKQTNLVKETCDLNNSPKINAVAVELRLKIVALDRKVWYNVSAADEAEIHDKEQ